jgi:hypothetical protein
LYIKKFRETEKRRGLEVSGAYDFTQRALANLLIAFRRAAFMKPGEIELGYAGVVSNISAYATFAGFLQCFGPSRGLEF